MAASCSISTTLLSKTQPRWTPLLFLALSQYGAGDVAASGAARGEVTSASMSMSLGQGVTVAAAVMTTNGNADSALADVLERVVPAPTSRWAAMIEEAPARVRLLPKHLFICVHMRWWSLML